MSSSHPRQELTWPSDFAHGSTERAEMLQSATSTQEIKFLVQVAPCFNWPFHTRKVTEFVLLIFMSCKTQ